MYILPERLKQVRTNLSLTQTQIAERLGMTYQEYQKIENGKTVIRADKLYHICNSLSVSADWLLGLNVNVQGRIITFPGSDFGSDLAAEPVILKQGK